MEKKSTDDIAIQTLERFNKLLDEIDHIEDMREKYIATRILAMTCSHYVDAVDKAVDKVIKKNT